MADPFAGKAGKAGALGNAGLQAVAFGKAVSETGEETEETQNAKEIFLDALMGVADKAYTPVFEIRAAIQGVENGTVGICIERIDREVAPGGVQTPVVGEGDIRVATVGFDVMAQCRHFVGRGVGDYRYRAMGEAGWNGAKTCFFSEPDRFVGRRCRRNVDIGCFVTLYWAVGRRVLRIETGKQRIADASADGAGLMTGCRQRFEYALRRLARQPFGTGNREFGLVCGGSHIDRISVAAAVNSISGAFVEPFRCRSRYSKWPGTSLPSTTWGGTYVWPGFPFSVLSP